ncbi:MAG: T9SS type A sorting domain-containing protein, partial [Saprospiraceae bacterium]
NFITVIRNAPAAALDLSITVDNLLYNPFEEVVYRVTVANDGTETLTDVVVNTPIPNGLVYTSSTQTQGDFNLFFERWNVGDLAAGESAYLDLTLFTLIRGEDITLNVDSGDETASVTITALENGGFGSNEGNADLELNMTTELADYTIYEPITFRTTIVNNGEDAATNVVVATGLPEGFAYTSSSVTTGRYNNFNEEWYVETLAAGESAYLDLTIFPLVTDVTVTQFAEVRSVFQQDPDSTPGNGDGQTANEDDEAVVVINSTGNIQPLGGINRLSFQEGNMTVNTLYPNPTYDQVMLNLVSMKDADAQISVVSQTGQIMQVLNREIAMGVTQLQLNVTDLPAGNYFIQIEGVNGERQARQFTKVD